MNSEADKQIARGVGSWPEIPLKKTMDFLAS